MTPGEMFSVWGLFSVFFFHFSFGIKESLQWVLEIRVPGRGTECWKSLQLIKRYIYVESNETEFLGNTVFSELFPYVPIAEMYLSKCVLWQAKTCYTCYTNMICCTEFKKSSALSVSSVEFLMLSV